MNKSKAKGTRAELALRDILRKETGLKWERTPGSGAMDAKYKMKGDLFIPNNKNNYLIEVKHYKDDALSSRVLTLKDPVLFEWWNKAVEQAEETGMKPMLIYKFDRSKWYIVSELSFTRRGVTICTGKYGGHLQTLDEFFKTHGSTMKWVG